MKINTVLSILLITVIFVLSGCGENKELKKMLQTLLMPCAGSPV